MENKNFYEQNANCSFQKENDGFKTAATENTQYPFNNGSGSINSSFSPVNNFPEEEIALFYEKKAVKKSSGKIGMGIMLFFITVTAIQLVLTIVLSILNKQNILSNDTFLLVLNAALSLVGYPLAAAYITGFGKEKIYNLVSFEKPKKEKFWPCIMVGLGFCYVSNVVVSVIQATFSEILPFAQTELELPEGISGFLITVLVSAVFPAFFEELLFRGAIMGSLLKFGKPFAIFTSAFIFGLFHGNLVQIPFAFMVGLVLGFVALESNSIWTAMVLHFLNNFISCLLEYAGMYFKDSVTDAIYIILLLVIIMLGFFGVYLLSIKNKALFKYEKTGHISTSAKRFGWLCSTPSIIVFFVFIMLEVIACQAGIA